MPSILRACGVLGVAVLAAFIPAAWWMWTSRGAVGVTAAAVAAVICLIGATGALLLTALLRGSSYAIHGLLGGMLLRLGLPLGVGVVLSSRGGDLARAGVFGLILLFYLLTLVVETLLSLKFVNRPRNSVQA